MPATDREELSTALSREDRRSLIRMYFALSYIEDMPPDPAARTSHDMVVRWIPRWPHTGRDRGKLDDGWVVAIRKPVLTEWCFPRPEI